jgi:hypothetical protein
MALPPVLWPARCWHRYAQAIASLTWRFDCLDRHQTKNQILHRTMRHPYRMIFATVMVRSRALVRLFFGVMVVLLAAGFSATAQEKHTPRHNIEEGGGDFVLGVGLPGVAIGVGCFAVYWLFRRRRGRYRARPRRLNGRE